MRAVFEIVVCDDGAVFYREKGRSSWVEDIPIPGTDAARASSHEMTRAGDG